MFKMPPPVVPQPQPVMVEPVCQFVVADDNQSARFVFGFGCLEIALTLRVDAWKDLLGKLGKILGDTEGRRILSVDALGRPKL